jgi:uncharacterized protein YecT (DUF1311 family)
MKKRLCFALGLVLMAALQAGRAQTQELKDPCQDGSTMAGNSCAQKKFAEADGRLNVEYKGLLANLATSEAGEKLRVSQRAWLKYRDAEAEYEAQFYKGGSGESGIFYTCLLRMTNARIEELKASRDI